MPEKCPECGDGAVTLTPEEGSILGRPIRNFVLFSEHGENISVTAFCWECKWETTKTLSVEVEE